MSAICMGSSVGTFIVLIDKENSIRLRTWPIMDIIAMDKDIVESVMDITWSPQMIDFQHVFQLSLQKKYLTWKEK